MKYVSNVLDLAWHTLDVEFVLLFTSRLSHHPFCRQPCELVNDSLRQVDSEGMATPGSPVQAVTFASPLWGGAAREETLIPMQVAPPVAPEGGFDLVDEYNSRESSADAQKIGEHSLGTPPPSPPEASTSSQPFVPRIDGLRSLAQNHGSSRVLETPGMHSNLLTPRVRLRTELAAQLTQAAGHMTPRSSAAGMEQREPSSVEKLAKLSPCVRTFVSQALQCLSLPAPALTDCNIACIGCCRLRHRSANRLRQCSAHLVLSSYGNCYGLSESALPNFSVSKCRTALIVQPHRY